MNAATFAPPPELNGLRTKAWVVGIIGVVLSIGGFMLDREQFFRSYLVSWLFWLGISLGCYALAMLHQLTRGAWGVMIRRMLGAAMRILPFVAIGFIPIVLGMKELYPWMDAERVAHDELIQMKTWYLNRNGFIFRGIAYFAVWQFFSWVLNRLSLVQDKSESKKVFRRMQLFAAPALAAYCLTATLASVDWLMSLDPHWYSSLYGVMFIAGHAVSAFAFVIPIALYLSLREPLAGQLRPRHFHDYGKLMLAFVALWTYFQLSQLIIVWSGNLPEEVTWYLARTQGGWKWVTITLILFHFVLPFLLLLSRDLKRDAKKLAMVALVLLATRWLELYWHAAPNFGGHGPDAGGLHFHWLDLATMLGVGGLWLALYLGQLASRPLLPAFEPFLREALDE